MQRILFCAFFCLATFLSQAQQFSIQGKVTDPQNSGLPNATVLLLRAADSTMVNYALSNLHGDFEIRNLSRAEYILRLTYIGYATRFVNINPPQGNILDLGTMALDNERVLLREVSVQEERIPMRVKNDTIEYDALAFKPLPNEMVEDLLKRMPGMEVQSDGNVVAQGETVRRVLVDGKEFFGRDPQMATQNLPADAVSKVQVFDQKSEQSQFTGIDDGQRERTINLELHEDRKEGSFGNSSLAYGTEERFQGKTNLNKFDKKGQISILGMANNINQQGFSIGEYMNFSGGTQNLMGGGGGGGNIQINMNSSSIPINFDGRPSTNGLMNSWAGGVNVNRKLSGKTELTASYFYNQLGHDIIQSMERENFMPSGNYNSDQQSTQDNNNYNHRLNLRLDHKFSEKSSVLFTTSTSANKTLSTQQNNSQTYNTDGMLQNSSFQLTDANGQRLNLESSLLWRQRLNKPGRTISSTLDFRANGNDQDASLDALNNFYGQMPDVHLLQISTLGSYNRSVGLNTNYTEPLGKRRFLEASYRITQNYNEVDQEVFDQQEQESIPNELLTNEYNNTYLYQRGGINFRLNRDRYNLTLGSSVQVTNLRGNLVTTDQQVNRNYSNLLPVARFSYEFNSFRRLMADYETSVQEPSVLQLQPLIDNRDPLNLYEGNPNLRPSYRHRGTVRFNTFNPVSSFGFFSFASADYVKNAITNSVLVDESFVRTVTPINVESNLSLRGNVNVNFALSKLKSRMSAGTTINHSQSVNVLNLLHQKIANNTLGANARYSFRPTDNFETSLTVNLNQQLTKYEFSPLEQAYLNQTFGSETTWSFLSHYRLGLNYRYQVYEGRTAAMDRKIPMLDFNISRSFLKNNAGEIRLSGFNLLDQDLGITQQVDANYIQRQVTNSLGRYILLSFTYSLNKGLNVMDGDHRQGGGMRIMRH